MHVLIDDWLYMEMEGKPGTYSREEVVRTLKSKMKDITGAFIDCETKLIVLPQKSAFSSDFIIQEERLSGQVAQIIAAPKDKVNDIYSFFKIAHIKQLVPYPVAIRAFLNSKGLMAEGRITVFVDDLKTQAIVTIFEGLRFTAPRRMSTRDLGYMATEIRRSEQNYLSQRAHWPGGDDLPFRIISNNSQWLSFFVEQGFCGRDEIMHVDALFPVLEGLKTAKFGMNFLPAEELARQKKNENMRLRVKRICLGIIFLSLCAGAYALVGVNRVKNERQIHLAESEQKAIEDQERAHNHRKFKHILKRRELLAFERVYYDFIQGVPVDHNIKEIDLSQDTPQVWKFTGIIYPSDGSVRGRDFMKQALFAKADVFAVIVDKKFGQKITFGIDRRPKQAIDLNTLPDDPIDAVEFYYPGVYEALRVLANFYDLKRTIEIVGLGEGGALSTAAKPSAWQGIRQINIKWIIYGIRSPNQILHVLEALGSLQNQYPISIASIKQGTNTLEIMLELYGQ